MPPLPSASAALRAVFLDCLTRFSACVRDVDYAAARLMFHPDVLAFGTHRDIIPGLEAWINTQWDNVWPKTTDFTFDLDGTHVLASADESMAVVVTPWTSTGYHQDMTPFDRPGRATMVFNRLDGAWICTHSHMSLNRGVPQASHANRPVKARQPEIGGISLRASSRPPSPAPAAPACGARPSDIR
jgi:ketosteroid isomerase-like protein